MQSTIEELYVLLDTIEQANNYLKTHDNSFFLFEDIKEAIHAINFSLFHTEHILTCEIDETIRKILEEKMNLEEYFLTYHSWHNIIKTCLEQRNSCKTDTDLGFYEMADYITFNSYNKILEDAIYNLKKIQSEHASLCSEYEAFYTFYKDFWGNLSIKENDFKVLENRISVLKEHSSDFIWLYEELGDYRSKMVLLGILKSWLTFDHKILSKIKETTYPSYFDKDLILCNKDEVFVDLGAYTGDSALSFIKTYRNYKKIYCYEITPESIEKIKYNLDGYKNIEIRQKGVGNKNASYYLQRIGITGAANQLNPQHGEQSVPIVTLDDDLQEKITFLKMDIEGAEQSALYGCKKHIIKEHPKLAICTYHNNEDIWKVPRIIKEMSPDYKLYMRYNGNKIGPVDFVLFAL